MISDNTKRYLTISLGGAPTVLLALLKEGSLEDFDRVVDPNRFTLREMLAHIGDWEVIFLGRLKQLRDESNPVLEGIDEGQWAIDHEHSSADVRESIIKYVEGRKKIIEFIGTLTPEDWEKTGVHTEVGRISLTEQLILISAHDGYHLLQAAEWIGGPVNA